MAFGNDVFKQRQLDNLRHGNQSGKEPARISRPLTSNASFNKDQVFDDELQMEDNYPREEEILPEETLLYSDDEEEQ